VYSSAPAIGTPMRIHDVGQVPADLDSGLTPPAQPPVALQEQLFAER
jgi:hypothetical protein